MTKKNYVCVLTDSQSDKLKEILVNKNWDISSAPYALWKAQKNKITAVAYQSGKFCVQGKDVSDFVQFILEPEVLEKAEFGYEFELAKENNPDMFMPHIGIDESGKGDYFGPLVVAAVYVDDKIAEKLFKMDVRDSKLLKNDKKITDIATDIKKLLPHSFSVLPIGPTTYNNLYKKIGNLNSLLAWGHARVLENVLKNIPSCKRAVSDQFAKKGVLHNALMKKGKKIEVEQYPRAEKDIAVAAASILARAEFVKKLEKLGNQFSVKLPKGASPQVVKVAQNLFAKYGMSSLEKIAKLHFKTTEKIC
ncbi:MAG: ribonuclease HIII [Verrucomicrobiota bacterium]|nr:ribonuclease HIII [Verrucomicrobiota bacterium]